MLRTIHNFFFIKYVLFKNDVKKFLLFSKPFCRYLNKMLVKITWKRIFFFLLSILFCLWLYLYRTNYFFDRKIRNLSGPLLKEVMEAGYYRLDKNISCENNINATVFCMDINNILLQLSKEYSELPIAMIKVTQLVSTPMRMHEDHIKNEIFNNNKEITCDKERRFEWLKKRHDNKMKLLRENKNARFYLLYDTVGGTNYEEMLRKIKENQGRIEHYIIPKEFYINYGTYWIFKYNNYYYFLFETNGVSSHHQHQKGDRSLIFKKLTLNQLKAFDNGFYWKLIQDYNIKID